MRRSHEEYPGIDAAAGIGKPFLIANFGLRIAELSTEHRLALTLIPSNPQFEVRNPQLSHARLRRTRNQTHRRIQPPAEPRAEVSAASGFSHFARAGSRR